MSYFVNKVIEYTKEYESPTAFWRWAAYSTIGALLRNNLFFKHGTGEVYPNIYVILLADSGGRKDPPLKLANKLLDTYIHTKVISGSASKEAILDYLSQDIAVRKSGVTVKGGQGIVIAPELAGFFLDDPKLIEYLTDWWDYKENYERNLRSGRYQIPNLCFSLLGGSNEELLQTIYTRRATYGGLLRRTLMVKPDETRPPNSLMYLDLTKFQLDTLLDPLKSIAQLKGPIKRTDGAARVYDSWYKDLHGLYKKFGDKSGVLQGMHTNVLKLAIIIAANRLSMEIDENDFNMAIDEVTKLRPNYSVYAMVSGMNSGSKIGGMILQAIYEAKGIPVKRTQLMNRYWNEMSIIELDEILDRLQQAEMIKFEPIDNSPAYKLTQKALDIFEKK